jgi:hypothetical protein
MCWSLDVRNILWGSRGMWRKLWWLRRLWWLNWGLA